MVVLTKKIIELHEIILDTNILHCEDKSYVVNKYFDTFWEKHCLEFNLSLKIPYVVVGELLFQQTTSALKTLSRANESLDRLSGFTKKPYSRRITESRVRKEIRDRMNSWLKTVKAETIQVPIDEINWHEIIEGSIWRKPPFSYDPKKDDLEKGFRDALILEALYYHAKSEEEHPVLFVTNDNLLREAAETKLKGINKVKFLSSIDEIESYLKLKLEDFTQSFVDSIIDKASLKFINKKDPTSIVYKENLRKVLFELAKTVIDDPSVLSNAEKNDFEPDDEWIPVSKGTFTRVGRSKFDYLENGHTFNWKEDVEFQRNYEIKTWDGDEYSATLIIEYEVKWKANVSENGRFTKVKYLSSNIKGKKIKSQEA